MTTPPVINLSTKVWDCRLGRQQLDALFTVASQGFQPAEVEVSHTRHNHTYTAGTLGDLIAAVTAAPLPSPIDKWDNLRFTATDPTGRRSVEMALARKEVSVEVKGSDATMVYGTETQIRLFLQDEAVGGHPAGTTLPLPRLWVWMGALCVLVMLYLTVSLTVMYGGGEVGAMVESALFLSLGPLVVVLLLALFSMVLHMFIYARSTRALLVPTRDLPTGSAWSRLGAIEKITAVGVGVAAVAAIGTLLSAGADVF
ncbi:hypothetical protein ACFTXJ_14520 [Streptomyces zhihengii]|uniref:hypothetical protein n=1 Tax=Streptomyces zhihengii TaxID=1818004 RepID=UPI0036272DEE